MDIVWLILVGLLLVSLGFVCGSIHARNLIINRYSIRGKNYPAYLSRPYYNRYLKTYQDRFENVVFSSRREAEDVMDQCQKLIDLYGVLTIADLYDLIGINTVYTDNNYGWYDIKDWKICRIRRGYNINVTKAKPITIEPKGDRLLKNENYKNQ